MKLAETTDGLGPAIGPSIDVRPQKDDLLPQRPDGAENLLHLVLRARVLCRNGMEYHQQVGFLEVDLAAHAEPVEIRHRQLRRSVGHNVRTRASHREHGPGVLAHGNDVLARPFCCREMVVRQLRDGMPCGFVYRPRDLPTLELDQADVLVCRRDGCAQRLVPVSYENDKIGFEDWNTLANSMMPSPMDFAMLLGTDPSSSM